MLFEAFPHLDFVVVVAVVAAAVALLSFASMSRGALFPSSTRCCYLVVCSLKTPPSIPLSKSSPSAQSTLPLGNSARIAA